MTDAFCREHLNDEYAMLCRNLAATLARKRPSPLLRGQLETWACGIIRTIGWVNFLDDSSEEPHLKLPFIDRAFGVAESTGQGKSKTDSQPAEDPRSSIRSGPCPAGWMTIRWSGWCRSTVSSWTSAVPTGTSGGSVREGTDPVHSRRPRWRFGGGRLNRWAGRESTVRRGEIAERLNCHDSALTRADSVFRIRPR